MTDDVIARLKDKAKSYSYQAQTDILSILDAIERAQAEIAALDEALKAAQPLVERHLDPYKDGWIEEKHAVLNQISAALALVRKGERVMTDPHEDLVEDMAKLYCIDLASDDFGPEKAREKIEKAWVRDDVDPARDRFCSAQSSAAQDVLAERERQKTVEGWTDAHDDMHEHGQMAGAAACYAINTIEHWARTFAIRDLWPWNDSWWKPKDGRRDLVRAGALILAEIERLDRAAFRQIERTE